MAVVVSHAMRRFPATPPGSSYSSNSNFIGGDTPFSTDITQSSLSRSMRYAEPWLYGSVRAPAGLFLTPALILCSCPEYINGTKRSSKKGPTVCKKCKGTRLPFSGSNTLRNATKFGTVRCYPTAPPISQISPSTRSGTVRVVSHSRPSILPSPGTADPYELMRRSRLSPENGTQYRINSITTNANNSNNDNNGRRSILECDINPYDLISFEAGNKDSSITLVNGQRVRIRPSQTPPEKEYEEIKVHTTPPQHQHSQIPKLKNVSIKKTNRLLKSIEKESECNRFKSILKKPTTFSDTDSSCGNERSPSPALKSGSHFYLPMPMNTTPRKKVQFLVENELVCQKELITKNDEDPTPDAITGGVYEDVVTEDLEKTTEEIKNSKLRRSVSERYIQESTENVVFHDTTALRSKSKKSDCRVAFSSVKNLQKLDGVSHIKHRPIRPPPPPPIKVEPKSEEVIVNSLVNESDGKLLNTPQQEVIDSESKKHVVNTMVKTEAEVPQLNQYKPVENDLNVSTIVELTKPTDYKTLIKEDLSEGTYVDVYKIVDWPPCAPPRKRSNSKIPTVATDCAKATIPVLTIQEAHIPQSPDYQNKTIVQITAAPTFHKIQIKNDFVEAATNVHTISVSDTAQRKTSILINGDDCYSTINVNDDVPMYQSSVVVKDNEPKANRSSTVYITNNVIQPENTIKDLQTTLRQILQDPVEAVKRNLVPHVCGKLDVTRRHNNQTHSSLDNSSIDDSSLVQFRNRDIVGDDDKDLYSDISSNTPYELMDGSDCYTDTSNRSSVTEEELMARTKFYEMLADSAIAEMSENEDHHYECIRLCTDPIYEEIRPPPLPSNPPPSAIIDDLQLDKQYTTRSIFEGASKYDILSYLVDAKERGIVPEDTYNFGNSDVVIEEDMKEISDSSEESSLVISDDKFQKSAEVERNDSGVGSETSKSSLSKYRIKPECLSSNCEDCDTPVETQTESESLICRKCIKKRSERKEIISEIVETEEKYSRDLQIVLEEFYQPMLVAGLLTSDQLSAIFLNVEELLENSQALAERLRDAVEIALEQGDEDLLTVNIGKLFLEAAPMLHAFETYCIRQGNASLLLASLEKDKELLRIFLRVSQMENTMLRRMNLNSFLMVPVQRVTKYPLLLTRLNKATPGHHENRDQLKEAQHKIELHLNHMNSETKDVPSKLWRRIGSNSGRRPSTEMDLVSIKLRKIAVDVLEWNHDEARFVLEGRLLFTQPTDNNWRKGRTIKLAPINALLVTNGKHLTGTHTEDDGLTFPRSGIREAALLLVRDKNGRYSLLREPLYLDRCIIATDPAWQSYFEVQEVIGKDTFIFKAEDNDLTGTWYRQLQIHAQGLGGWRKRRNALANIMINGRGSRS